MSTLLVQLTERREDTTQTRKTHMRFTRETRPFEKSDQTFRLPKFPQGQAEKATILILLNPFRYLLEVRNFLICL